MTFVAEFLHRGHILGKEQLMLKEHQRLSGHSGVFVDRRLGWLAVSLASLLQSISLTGFSADYRSVSSKKTDPAPDTTGHN